MSELYKIFLVAVFLFAGFGAMCVADEDADTVEGKVKVVKSAGKVTAVTVTASEEDEDGNEVTVVYNVELDAKGLELANKANGKDVEVEGKVTLKGKSKWIKVAKYFVFEYDEDDE
jgi:hypothetical protein